MSMCVGGGGGEGGVCSEATYTSSRTQKYNCGEGQGVVFTYLLNECHLIFVCKCDDIRNSMSTWHTSLDDHNTHKYSWLSRSNLLKVNGN